MKVRWICIWVLVSVAKKALHRLIYIFVAAWQHFHDCMSTWGNSLHLVAFGLDLDLSKVYEFLLWDLAFLFWLFQCPLKISTSFLYVLWRVKIKSSIWKPIIITGSVLIFFFKNNNQWKIPIVFTEFIRKIAKWSYIIFTCLYFFLINSRVEMNIIIVPTAIEQHKGKKTIDMVPSVLWSYFLPAFL